jgi:hypothetical protein
MYWATLAGRGVLGKSSEGQGHMNTELGSFGGPWWARVSGKGGLGLYDTRAISPSGSVAYHVQCATGRCPQLVLGPRWTTGCMDVYIYQVTSNITVNDTNNMSNRMATAVANLRRIVTLGHGQH